MTVSEANEETFQQTLDATRTRASNPIYHFLAKCTTSNPAFNEMERSSNHNCAMLRQSLREYIQKRASGAEQSKFEGSNDLLTLMMASPEIFKEDLIIDELIDFLTAGTQTTQNATQTVLSHFALNPNSVKRLREEYK